MKAFRVKIIKANLPMYWYAHYIDETFWVYVDERKSIIDDYTVYTVIDEGVTEGKLNKTSRWINKDDCVILKEADITVKKLTTIQIIENV